MVLEGTVVSAYLGSAFQEHSSGKVKIDNVETKNTGKNKNFLFFIIGFLMAFSEEPHYWYLC